MSSGKTGLISDLDRRMMAALIADAKVLVIWVRRKRDGGYRHFDCRRKNYSTNPAFSSTKVGVLPVISRVKTLPKYLNFLVGIV